MKLELLALISSWLVRILRQLAKLSGFALVPLLLNTVLLAAKAFDKNLPKGLLRGAFLCVNVWCRYYDSRILILHKNLQQPIPPLWLSLWVPLLALAWLLPNHYYPWATFHTDAWVAVMLAIAAVATFIRGSALVNWHGLPFVMALLAVVPFFQFWMGILHFSGSAWVCTLYVLGLLLALLSGSRWEAGIPGKAADGLFMAIGIAALVSVGLQLLSLIHI